MSDTSPKDQNALLWNHRPVSARVERAPGELVFEFVRADHHRIRCELLDDGPYGFDVRFFRNEEFTHSVRMPNRDFALAYATAERALLEQVRPR